MAVDRTRLAPDSSLAGEKKQKAIEEANEVYQQVLRNCERANTAVPPYEFIELIGKGAFGRVFKCRRKTDGDLVAVKIVDTDEIDYYVNVLDRDDTVRDFRKEVTILQQLKDSNAKNVNMIHDAFDLQQQLWIVSDYCTGGSVRTLMRPQTAPNPGLEEQYIIPIARELALAMKSVHDIGVIHRDIKCGNVYITEEGRIQLGDFGIVGVLDDGVSKRTTMIGTPHYMPREMLIAGDGNRVAEAYGTEVDIWSYGCTVYEMACGLPPNAVKRQDLLKTELLNAPRLEGPTYSQELKDFVAFCLTSDPRERPTAEQVLQHPYVANTYKKHPTRKLVELIHRFKAWEYKGGWRQSLFFAGGAPSGSGVNDKGGASDDDSFPDWSFSTSDAFDKRYSQMTLDEDSESSALDIRSDIQLPSLNTDLTPLEKLKQAQKDISANRGERSLERLFTPESDPYELHTPVDVPSPTSDLPFRKFSDSAPTRESHIMIDLDDGGESDMPSYNFDFGDAPTLKAKSIKSSLHDEEDDEYGYGETDEDRQKRATMDWKFPTAKPTTQRATMEWKFPSLEQKKDDDPNAKMNEPYIVATSDLPTPFRPALKHTATEPVGQFRDFLHPAQQGTPPSPVRDSMASMIDLDLGLSDPADIPRPSTASSTAGSTMTDMTSGNPFDLEDDPVQNEIDRNRFSYHKSWRSEGGPIKRSSHRSMPMHERGSSLSSTVSDMEQSSSTEDDDVFNYGYSRRPSESMRSQMNGTLVNDSTDLDQWPDFGPNSGFDRVRNYTDDLDMTVRKQRELDTARQRGATNGQGPIITGRPELEFPRIAGPHPDALTDEADPYVVETELNRLIDDLSEGLEITIGALEQASAVEEVATNGDHQTGSI